MNDLQRYLVHEFVADYKDGYLTRRELIKRVLHITGGIASTATLLSAMGCGPSAPAPATPTQASAPTTAPASAATRPPATTAPTTAAASTGIPAVPTPAPRPTTAAAASPTAAVATVPSPGASPVAAGQARSPLSVAENDPAVEAQMISFPGNGTTILAYLARPRGASGPQPVVLVCHENRGLVDHIKDVARRFAKQGYVACAVDLLSRQGGTDKIADGSAIPGLLSNMDPTQEVGDFRAAATYLSSQPYANKDRIGMNGFCFGGGITWRAVVSMPELKAAVPFYGPPPPLDQVPNAKAAVFGVYSSDPQDFANNGREQLDQALTKAGVVHQFKVYPNTQHAFFNDTGPRYNQEQALIAWQDMLNWFARYLKV